MFKDLIKNMIHGFKPRLIVNGFDSHYIRKSAVSIGLSLSIAITMMVVPNYSAKAEDNGNAILVAEIDAFNVGKGDWVKYHNQIVTKGGMYELYVVDCLHSRLIDLDIGQYGCNEIVNGKQGTVHNRKASLMYLPNNYKWNIKVESYKDYRTSVELMATMGGTAFSKSEPVEGYDGLVDGSIRYARSKCDFYTYPAVQLTDGRVTNITYEDLKTKFSKLVRCPNYRGIENEMSAGSSYNFADSVGKCFLTGTYGEVYDYSSRYDWYYSAPYTRYEDLITINPIIELISTANDVHGYRNTYPALPNYTTHSAGRSFDEREDSYSPTIAPAYGRVLFENIVGTNGAIVYDKIIHNSGQPGVDNTTSCPITCSFYNPSRESLTNATYFWTANILTAGSGQPVKIYYSKGYPNDCTVRTSSLKAGVNYPTVANEQLPYGMEFSDNGNYRVYIRNIINTEGSVYRTNSDNDVLYDSQYGIKQVAKFNQTRIEGDCTLRFPVQYIGDNKVYYDWIDVGVQAGSIVYGVRNSYLDNKPHLLGYCNNGIFQNMVNTGSLESNDYSKHTITDSTINTKYTTFTEPAAAQPQEVYTVHNYCGYMPDIDWVIERPDGSVLTVSKMPISKTVGQIGTIVDGSALIESTADFGKGLIKSKQTLPYVTGEFKVSGGLAGSVDRILDILQNGDLGGNNEELLASIAELLNSQTKSTADTIGQSSEAIKQLINQQTSFSNQLQTLINSKLDINDPTIVNTVVEKAKKADALENSITISANGDVLSSGTSFDGSKDVTINLNLSDDSKKLFTTYPAFKVISGKPFSITVTGKLAEHDGSKNGISYKIIGNDTVFEGTLLSTTRLELDNTILTFEVQPNVNISGNAN